MNWRGYFIITCIICSCEKADPPEVFDYQKLIPQGFPIPEIPADNLPTQDRIALGRKLFYDVDLSKNRSKSCASCHQQQFAFADNVALSEGILSRKTSRNTPSLSNVVYQSKLLREGSLSTLETQILVPIQEHNEFDFSMVEIVSRLNEQGNYKELAQKAYARALDAFVITRAIASFERTFFSGDSKYDRYNFQNKKYALTEKEVNGLKIFNSDKTQCATCHSGFLFTNQSYANNGIYLEYADEGRMRFTGKSEDEALFKIPSLRNIALTAPYMFDGSMNTLEEVISHYESGGKNHFNKSPLLKPFNLTAEERSDLISFLWALSDDTFIKNPSLSKE